MDNLQARLDATPCYLGDTPTDAPTAYVVATPTAGHVTPAQYARQPIFRMTEITLMCVSDSAPGCLRLAEYVRSRVTGWTPPTSEPSRTPYVEYGAGPLLTETTTTSHRYSTTLVYRAWNRNHIS